MNKYIKALIVMAILLLLIIVFCYIISYKIHIFWYILKVMGGLLGLIVLYGISMGIVDDFWD